MRPVMQVVGGPSGSGKSRGYPVAHLCSEHFNVDDRCRALHGSYHAIPPEIRGRANEECEAFIAQHIAWRRSFAVETTLRSDITFQQADAARAQGFRVLLLYVGTERVEENLARVAARARLGGHSAPPSAVREIYARSTANLPRAIREFDHVRVYDNTAHDTARLRLVLEAHDGRITHAAPRQPTWVRAALRATEYDGALSPAERI